MDAACCPNCNYPRFSRQNKHEGSQRCDCSCCSSRCPYCALAILVAELKNLGVSADVAAHEAAIFVAQQCCK